MSESDSAANDASLSERALGGDHRAFSQFMRGHQEPLYRFIRRYVGDADEAYDLLQETFIAAWEALSRYDRDRPAGVWLRRIALNKCRDWSRRRAVRRFFFRAVDINSPAAAALSVATDEILGEADQLQRLDAAIAALPAALKEPLLLTVFDGLSHQAAGEALGISAKAVESRIARARKLLAQALNDV